MSPNCALAEAQSHTNIDLTALLILLCYSNSPDERNLKFYFTFYLKNTPWKFDIKLGEEDMKYTRIYCDDAGDSLFEDVSVEVSPGDYAPPAPPLNLAAPIDSERIILFSVPAGWVGDWHPSPCRQFYIQLSGELEIQVGDGEIRKFSAGSMILVEDTSGRGHVSRNLGNSEVNAVFVQLSAGSKEAV